MFERLASGALAVSFALIGASVANAQPAPALRTRSGQLEPAAEGRQTLSPLHSLLGIDPITGEFKRPGAPQRAGESPTPRAAPTATPGSEDALIFENSHLGTLPGQGQLSEATLDDFRAAISRAIDEHDDDALAAAFTNLTRGAGYEGFSLVSPQIERLGYLALFLYPLGIVLSEMYGVWSRRNTPVRAERERRYWARHLCRRLVLAAVSIITIGLFWWAGEHRFWWNEPQRLLSILTVLASLLAISALLRLIIARAAKDYPFRVIEDLRVQQFALESEIKELRRRLQGDGLTDAV